MVPKINKKTTYGIILPIFLLIFFLLFSFNRFNTITSIFRLDLRNRIIGSRILADKQGVSPYFYKWNTKDGDYYLDPFDTPDLIMNRNTVTPFTLQGILPFAHFNFANLTYYWYFAEVIALLLILVLFSVHSSLWQDRLYISFIVIGVIGLSQAWELHNLAGQIYIFLALFLSIIYCLSLKENTIAEIITGILLTSFVLIRPNFILFILPFIIRFRIKVLFSFFILIIIYFSIIHFNNMTWLWKDYFEAMNLWYHEFYKPDLTRMNIEVYNLKKVDGGGSIHYLPEFDFLENSSLGYLVHRVTGFQMNKLHLVLVGFTAFSLFFVSLFKKIKKYSFEKLFIMAFVFYFISELCIPAIRNSYNSVQWVFPLLLIGNYIRENKYSWLLLIIGFFHATGLMKFMPYDLFITEIIFLLLCLMYLFNKKANVSINYHRGWASRINGGL